jgi:hypothetical protein
LIGDFNAHTSNLNDFIDLDNISHTDSNSYLPTNYSADLPLIRRQNMDTSINEQGKHLIDLCIKSKIVSHIIVHKVKVVLIILLLVKTL